MSEPAEPAAPSGQEKRDKKKDKDRQVWISFIGRIVAQVVGAVASVVLGILVLQRYQDSRPEPGAETVKPAPARTHGEQAIAVLPLDNFSRESADEYFARGMTEVLISDLAQIKGWRVISRTSTEAYRGSGKSIAQIGAELNADLIVEGSVAKAGDQVRVVVQLIDAKSDEHIWARTYDRSTRDAFALQSQLATEIARSVKAAIIPEHEARLVKRATFNPVVYDLYLRGRHAWNLRTPEGLASAVKLFSEAIDREPDFALAHVGLADSYSLGGSPASSPAGAAERVAKAKASARRALEIADYLAEAHTAMAGVLFFGERDIAGAEREFRRAIQLNPNYPLAHQWLAILLAEGGRDAEAQEHADTAVKLDPMEATFHQARGLVHYYGRRFSDAVAAERRAIEIRPQLPFARVVLVKALMLSGDASGAVRACDEADALDAASTDLLITCGIALRRANDRRAQTVLDRLKARRPLPTSALLQWHATVGDRSEALALLRELQKTSTVPPSLAFDPLFEPLRSEPRYVEMMLRK